MTSRQGGATQPLLGCYNMLSKTIINAKTYKQVGSPLNRWVLSLLWKLVSDFAVLTSAGSSFHH